MPRKVRELLDDLRSAGFVEVRSGGKGSHPETHATWLCWRGDGERKVGRREAVSGTAPSRRWQMRPSDSYHKWIEWSDLDDTYLGRCPDVITGIHGSDPVRLYDELCTVVDEVLTELERSHRTLPQPLTRPMREVA